MNAEFDVPVLLLTFNRISTTRQVFEAIKRVRPKYLYIAQDGPRNGVDTDLDKCKEVREYIFSSIDWDCEVHKMIRTENMGCGISASTAVDWFFSQVEKGIVLEDDTVPETSFFTFCKDMLEIFEHDDKVMHIGSSNWQFSKIGERNYYFSKLVKTWGWATWRRAWKHFDFSMKNFTGNNKYFGNKEFDDYWNATFKLAKAMPSVWDWKWLFNIWDHAGYAITPQACLTRNIGFGEMATHTFNKESPFNNIKVGHYEGIDRSADHHFEYFAYADINEMMMLHNFKIDHLNHYSGSALLKASIKKGLQRIR